MTQSSSKRWIGLGLGIVGFICIWLATELGWFTFSYGTIAHQPKIGRMLAVTWLMAMWWMTEAVPIPITSLLPVVLFPCLKILPSSSVAKHYMNEIILLFMGGFFLALAIQKWDLHKRISLHIVHKLGENTANMVLGFMLASAGLSMWISNTATTMMLLPIGLSVTHFYEKENPTKGKRLGLLLMLSIAYSASIGGIATLVGTPPNLSFIRIYKINFPNAPDVSFLQWMKIGLPITLILLPLFWFVMTRFLFRDAVAPDASDSSSEARSIVAQKLHALGPMKQGEKWVLLIFVLTATLWMTRVDIRMGQHFKIPGWTHLLGLTYTAKKIKYKRTQRATTTQPSHSVTTYQRIESSRVRPLIGDGGVAIAMALLLFLISVRKEEDSEPEPLMDWETAKHIPWGMLLLFGGGFALAGGIKHSGMSTWIGEFFKWKGFSAWGALGIIFLICLLITFVTEFTSNTATTEITLAIVAPIAVVFSGTGVHPFLLMLPVTIAASCAFMMPVATAPNAIAYSTGYIPMKTMIRTGILLNLLSTIVVAIVLYCILHMMGIPLLEKPAWLH